MNTNIVSQWGNVINYKTIYVLDDEYNFNSLSELFNYVSAHYMINAESVSIQIDKRKGYFIDDDMCVWGSLAEVVIEVIENNSVEFNATDHYCELSKWFFGKLLIEESSIELYENGKLYGIDSISNCEVVIYNIENIDQYDVVAELIGNYREDLISEMFNFNISWSEQ